MRKPLRRAAALLLGSFLLLSGCTVSDVLQSYQIDPPPAQVQQTGSASVHYIDVGQGDATLIQTAGKNILIDSGTRASSDILLNYLREQGVTELELCVATHPHEDHIGGMPDVINEFTVKELYMPTKTTTTKIFQSMVETAQQRGVTITPAKVGDTFTIGDASLQVLFPDREYKDLNNNSVTIQLSLGGKTFLFTGDNEKESEAAIVSNFGNALKSDVFQAGHHGSDTSNTAGFLQLVSPSIIVISCGEGNSYGHPHEKVLERFSQLGAAVYRTDLDGTIVITIDNGTLSVQKEN